MSIGKRGMSKPVKSVKQLTFDRLPTVATNQDTKRKPVIQKHIYITQMETIIRIDELILKIIFKLEPSWRAFSKIKADLFFEDTQISTVSIGVLQGPLGTNELEYSWIIDTKGIAKDIYRLKVDMYETWSSSESLCQTSRELTVNYVPQTRQSRLIKIPFVKKVIGADVAVVTNQEKQIYTDIEKAVKKEQYNRRDI
jgi:hypothetical protein